MSDEKLFRIGDVARMFHLSVGTLRHYEAIGLLSPETVDPETGYRYYSVRQFEALNTIRYLRVLEMPLMQIEDFLKNRDVALMEEKLREQREIVLQKQAELARIEQKIANRLRRLREAQSCTLDVIHLAERPACRIAWISGALHIQNFHDMETPVRKLAQSQDEPLAFLGKIGVGISAQHLLAGSYDRYDGVFVVLDEEDRFEGETICLPAERCACLCFCGIHTQAPVQYERMLRWMAERHLTPGGFSREITLIDYGMTNDPQKFVTEICIPVRENTSAESTGSPSL